MLLILQWVSVHVPLVSSNHDSVQELRAQAQGSNQDCTTIHLILALQREPSVLRTMAQGPLPGPLYFFLTLPHCMIHPNFPYYLQLTAELPLQFFFLNLHDSLRKFEKSCIFNWLVQKRFFFFLSLVSSLDYFITQKCISLKCTVLNLISDKNITWGIGKGEEKMLTEMTHSSKASEMPRILSPTSPSEELFYLILFNGYSQRTT